MLLLVSLAIHRLESAQRMRANVTQNIPYLIDAGSSRTCTVCWLGGKATCKARSLSVTIARSLSPRQHLSQLQQQYSMSCAFCHTSTRIVNAHLRHEQCHDQDFLHVGQGSSASVPSRVELISSTSYEQPGVLCSGDTTLAGAPSFLRTRREPVLVPKRGEAGCSAGAARLES